MGCSYHDYSNFDNLTAAKDFCKYDISCNGVWDYEGRGDNFYLCHIGYDYDSCIPGGVYDKQGIQTYLI